MAFQLTFPRVSNVTVDTPTGGLLDFRIQTTIAKTNINDASPSRVILWKGRHRAIFYIRIIARRFNLELNDALPTPKVKQIARRSADGKLLAILKPRPLCNHIAWSRFVKLARVVCTDRILHHSYWFSTHCKCRVYI